MKKLQFSTMMKCLMAVLYLVIFSTFMNAQFDDKFVLFIVADETAPYDAENEITWRLEEMGFDVTVWGQEAVSDDMTEGMDLIMISATVSSGTIGDNMPGLIDLAIPVISWEPFLYDHMGFQAADGGEFNNTMIDLINDTHPLAAGLNADIIDLTTIEKAITYGMPEGNADIIAVNPDDETQVVLFGYEAGAMMSTVAAPARRVGTFLLNDVADALTEEGWALFDASVIWAMGAENTSVERSVDVNPIRYRLLENYPDPFNPVTCIEFSIPEQSRVRLDVYNALGKKVSALISDVRPAGHYQTVFDASGLQSGLYYYRLEAGTCRITKKMVLLK